MKHFLFLAFLLCGALPLTLPAQADGALDATFNANTDPGALTLAFAPQADGKIIIGGNFSAVNGTARAGLARLNTDGSLDAAYNPGALPNGFVASAVLQPDGKLIVTGMALRVGAGTSGVARLNADGSIDPSFTAAVTGAAYSCLLQGDGKIVIGGDFAAVGGVTRNRVARLNPDGTLDTSFNPGAGANAVSFSVFGLSLQPDGKILVTGGFTSFAGTPRGHLVRLNTDGSVDAAFNPGTAANSMTNGTLVLPDGGILLFGDFSSFNGTARASLARLNANGSLDASFDAKFPGGVFINALVRQTDGKLIAGGQFSGANGVARDGLIRLNADGSVDLTFSAGTGVSGSAVYSVKLGSDGTLLIGGNFTTVNGVAHIGAARLSNAAGLPPARLINISTRARVETNDRVLIAGFVLGGSAAKRVIVRAIGPDLANFGVTAVLSNPQLALFNAQGQQLSGDDDWKTGGQMNEIVAANLAPHNDLEAALIATLAPGAYTAIVSGVGGGQGVALVEVYDLDIPNQAVHLINLSTRGVVGAGENVLIGGIAIRGDAPRRVIIRAIGPDLANFGVAGALGDPTLTVFDDRSQVVATNDNWKTGGQMAEIVATGLAPRDERESAIIATLSPGNYTAIVAGVAGATGVALVEAYELP